jgi:hypothetical protein
MISAIGILSIFSRRTARLKVSHCSGSITFPPDDLAQAQHRAAD